MITVVFYKKWELSGVTKKRKTLKRADIRPLFGFCGYVLVVIVREGCK